MLWEHLVFVYMYQQELFTDDKVLMKTIVTNLWLGGYKLSST